MASFDRIKPGDTLYDCRKTGQIIRYVGTWTVRVIEVYPEKRTALVSWNGNKPEIWHETRLKRLRRSRPGEKSQPGGQLTEKGRKLNDD